MSHRTMLCVVLAACFAVAAAGRAAAAPHDALPITLQPVQEQVVDTPVPIYVEIGGDTTGLDVLLYYHPSSGEKWHHRKMKPVGKGFGATIPCKRVRNEAIVEYYVRIKKRGKTVARSGSKKKPFAVAFVPALKGEAPSLPGKDPPRKCKKKKPKPEESPVDTGLVGQADTQATAHKKHHKYKRLFFVLGVVQDLALLGGDDVCADSSQDAGYYCFRDDGQQYLGNPLVGNRDKISSGFALSATRVVVGLDYVLGRAALGARVGYTLRGNSPTPGGGSAWPLLAAARLEYWLARHAYDNKGFSMYLLAEGGLAETDATHRVDVVEDTTKPSKQVNPLPGQSVDAWKRMGRGFGGVGLGGFVPIGKSGGLTLELEGKLLFPASGFAVAPGLAYAAGF